MLGSALYQAGNYTESISAFQALLNRYPDHPQALLLLARTLGRCGRNPEALKVLTHAWQVNPDHTQIWQVAVALAAEIRDWAELLRIAEAWTQQQPDSLEAWQALSRAHFEESRFDAAIAAYAGVLKLAPGNPAILVGAARLAIAAQQYDQARTYLDAAQKLAPDLPELLYTLGRLHHMTGDLVPAEDCFRRAIKARPDFATAYVELGTLREGRMDDGEIEAVRKLFGDRSVHPEYRVMLGFTLGDALDRRKDYAQAFAAWDRANEINRAISEQEGITYQPARTDSEPELLAALFSNLDCELEPLSSKHPRPIFVVGMPRSGTTLIESILASHSEVYGAGELPTLYDIYEEMMEVARGQGIAVAREMVRSKAASWRQRYLEALPAAAVEACVVDKQPMNFRSIGLIRLLFPDSPVIFTVRSPLDVGLSIYRHKFSKNWPCAHRLSDIGHYYGMHTRVFELWKSRYPDAFLTVNHADMVQDTQAEIGRVLEFAGLSLQAACFSPHETKRPIATFSSVQVRQPVSAAFSGRARHYDLQLAPLREALLKAGVDVESGLTERSTLEGDSLEGVDDDGATKKDEST
jgi:tetratricopeptide (TPR) repeat protein